MGKNRINSYANICRTHEYHAPMTGVISMAETIVESYHKLNDQQRLDAAEVILKSSRSLKAFDDNITTLTPTVFKKGAE